MLFRFQWIRLWLAVCLPLVFVQPTQVLGTPSLRFSPLRGPRVIPSNRPSRRWARSDRCSRCAGVKNSYLIRSLSIHSAPTTVNSLAGSLLGLISISIDQYTALEYDQRRSDLWQKQVRRAFRQTSLQQRRQKSSRFEWTVPFSAPKPLRRFIGDEGPACASTVRAPSLSLGAVSGRMERCKLRLVARQNSPR